MSSVDVEQVEVVDSDRGDVGAQFGRPRRVGEREVQLSVDDRPAVFGIQRAQPGAVVHAGHGRHGEAGVDEQLGQFGRIELTGVERIERGVAAG